MFPTKVPGRGTISPPALRGFVGNFDLERTKTDEETIIFPCVGPMLMYGPDCFGDGGRT